jgi:LysM repeat protein
MKIIQNFAAWMGILALVAAFLLFEMLTTRPGGTVDSAVVENLTTTPEAATLTSSETIPPSTPLATLTPSQTLRPPPTFEPPSPTPIASATPTVTPTPTAMELIDVPGLHGLETPTPSTTPGCVPRADWKLTYTVQANDALDLIAERYGTNRWTMAEANCLADPNLIVVGQELRVPGETHPQEPEVECVPWEVLTPANLSFGADPGGSITFNWRGPRAPRNLIRVYKPDGSVWEVVVDFRQNHTVNLIDALPAEGMYTWQVFPLGLDFFQIACKESDVWSFYKEESPTPTPTQDPSASAGGGW